MPRVDQYSQFLFNSSNRFNPWLSYHFAWSLYDDHRPLFTSTKGKFADLQWFLVSTRAIYLLALMQGQNFKIGILPFWLQIWIPHKKVWIESVLLFLIFWLEHGQIQGQRLKLIFCLNLPLFSALNLKFDNVPIIISKKGKHFQFILFWEEFKSAIRFVKFLLWNFSLP